MGSFFSKLLTGNPFAQGGVGQNLAGSLGGAIPGMPQTSLQSILGGKGGGSQPIDYSGILKAGTSQAPTAGQGPAGTSNIVAPQKFGGGLIGAARRRF